MIEKIVSDDGGVFDKINEIIDRLNVIDSYQDHMIESFNEYCRIMNGHADILNSPRLPGIKALLKEFKKEG